MIIKCKETSVVFFRTPKSIKIHRLEISYKEQKQYFCHRKKRQYISTKFLFKFIKKQILTEYKNESPVNKKIPHKLIVMQFNDQYLLNEKYQKLYYSENINKTTLLTLAEKDNKILPIIQKYVANKFLFDLVDKFYNDFSVNFFKNDYNIYKFCDYFIIKSHNKPFLFEDCELSFRVLNEIFKFES